MKENLDWFKHDSDSFQHPKFYMLRAKYGWAGEGRFWALNSIIAKTNGCKIDLNKKYVKAPIASKLELSIDELDEFIMYLAEECDLIIIENNVIYTEKVTENYTKMMAEREKARLRKANQSVTHGEKSKSSGEPSKSSGGKSKSSTKNLRDIRVDIREDIREEVYAFEDFWNTYRKKIDKAKCQDKWKKLTDAQKRKIKEVLPVYVADTERENAKYRKHPIRWLNGKCWNDEILIEKLDSEKSKSDWSSSSNEAYRKLANEMSKYKGEMDIWISELDFNELQKYEVCEIISKAKEPQAAIRYAMREIINSGRVFKNMKSEIISFFKNEYKVKQNV